MEGVGMAKRVLKIKCKCRPTPQGVPRPVSNLLWLKQAAHANRYMAPPFDRHVRNAVVTETGEIFATVDSFRPFRSGENVYALECTKCHRVHTVSSARLKRWWGDYLNGGTPSVEL